MGRLSDRLQPSSYWAQQLQAPPHPAARRGMDDRPGVMGVADVAPQVGPIVDRMTFLPWGQDAQGNQTIAWPDAFASLADAAMVPGRLMQGEQMTPDQMQGAAFDLAGMGMAGSLVGAPVGALGSGPVRNAVGDAAQGAARLADDLPMDEASRMARAAELFPVDAYHGTRGDFSEFEIGDLGFHFGTPEQANKRLRATAKTVSPGGENVIPARLNIRNPIDLADVGMWNDPEAVARELMKSPVGRQNAADLDYILNETADLRPQFDGADDWLSSPEATGMIDEMRGMIESAGYDGVRYLNQVENAFGDVAGLTPAATAEKSRLYRERQQIYEAVNNRFPAPDPQAPGFLPEDVARWLETPKLPNPDEAARIEAIDAAMRAIEETGRGSPYSYIAFDPAQIRSRFARFDPRKVSSRDLLASGAGGLLGLGLLSGGEAEAGQ